LGPIDILQAIDLFRKKFENIYYLFVNGDVTEENLKQLQKLLRVFTLVIDSQNTVDLSWFCNKYFVIELIVKAPISISDSTWKPNNELQVLRLYNCTSINDFRFIDNYYWLNVLTLRHGPQLTLQQIEPVFMLTQLISLDLSGTPLLTDELLLQIVASRWSLETFLAVKDTSAGEGGFTDQGITAFLNSASTRNLNDLNLSGHQSITSASLNGEIRCLKQLKWLGLRKTGCNSADSVRALVTKRGQLLAARMRWNKLPKLTISISATDPTAEPNTEHIGTVNNSVDIEINTIDRHPTYGYSEADANSLNDLLIG
jgi:hypothetical protein